MRHEINYIKKHPLLFLIIIPAFLLYMLLIFPSGTNICFKNACGLNFWGVHGHDAIWHLAIANTSFAKIPFIAPTFSGELLYGYNYFLDLLIYFASRLGIPQVILYFKIFPVVWFIIFTLLLVKLARALKDTLIFVTLFLLFSYFAGSFSYIISLIHHGTINGSSTILAQPAMHAMSNLPYAFSLIPFTYILILMLKDKLDNKFTVKAGIAAFVIMGLKFYGGVISIVMILAFLIIKYLRKDIKKLTINIIQLSLIVLCGIFFFYNPFTSLKTGAIFGFAPFALIHTITEEPGYFYLRDMTDARYYLVEHGIGPRLIAIESINMILFLFFYLGTRFFALGYITLLILKRKLNTFDCAVMTAILLSIILTSTLVQKAEWWNTIQFFYYAIFLLTIYLTKLSYSLFSSKYKIARIVLILIVLLSLPTSYDLIRLFAAYPGATYIPREELQALKYLKKLPKGVVFTPLYNKAWKKTDIPNPLYAYEDTAYVAAFTGHQTYYANLLQLRLTGVPYEKRLNRIVNKDCSIVYEFDYIYEQKELTDNDKIRIYCKLMNLEKIYENKKIGIYRVIKND